MDFDSLRGERAGWEGYSKEYDPPTLLDPSVDCVDDLPAAGEADAGGRMAGTRTGVVEHSIGGRTEAELDEDEGEESQRRASA